MRKIATLLILFAVLSGGLALEPAPLRASQEASLTPRAYLPFLSRQSLTACSPVPGATYGTLTVNPPPTDRPAHVHADLNLAMRGYEVTGAPLVLVDYGGGEDPGAPYLPTLFSAPREPSFTAAYQVYDWNWACNCRGGLLDRWPTTLIGMVVAPAEIIHLPDSGYDIGSGYDALVLYATEERITLKYTREDNVVHGYTIHIENICVEPSLLALYQAWNAAGRGQLPALRGGQPLGRARSGEIRVATRDNGEFMDPRSRKDWW
jgi:hypothetical protein